MSNVAIVYHSGFGHTKALAEAVAAGAQAVPGIKTSLIPVAEAEAREAELDAADAIIFGSPTYMGSVSADFAKFNEWTSKRWMARAWQNKLAAGFTNSHSFAGDKGHALESLTILAAQHGMNWVNLGLAPPNVTAAERGPDTINRVGSFLGVAAQSDNASTEITPPAGDRETARLLGERVAKAAVRWAAGAEASASLGKAA